jgi:hypothetical protein
MTEKYEMPAVRSQLLEAVRDAYPDSFAEFVSAEPPGESVFSGPTPHPNEVLNLFIQQKLTSALPVAYYMAVHRGVDSLTGEHLPQSGALSPMVVQTAIKGFVTLREAEFNETHRLIFGPKDSQPCSTSSCFSRAPTSPKASEVYQEVFDYIVGSPESGTKLLQVPEFYGSNGFSVHVFAGICSNCVGGLESGHAVLRRRLWATLPDAFGLK